MKVSRGPKSDNITYFPLVLRPEVVENGVYSYLKGPRSAFPFHFTITMNIGITPLGPLG